MTQRRASSVRNDRLRLAGRTAINERTVSLDAEVRCGGALQEAVRRRMKRGGDWVQLVAPAAYLPVAAQLGQHACRSRPRRLAPAPNRAQEWVEPDRPQ